MCIIFCFHIKNVFSHIIIVVLINQPLLTEVIEFIAESTMTFYCFIVLEKIIGK